MEPGGLILTKDLLRYYNPELSSILTVNLLIISKTELSTQPNSASPHHPDWRSQSIELLSSSCTDLWSNKNVIWPSIVSWVYVHGQYVSFGAFVLFRWTIIATLHE